MPIGYLEEYDRHVRAALKHTSQLTVASQINNFVTSDKQSTMTQVGLYVVYVH